MSDSAEKALEFVRGMEYSEFSEDEKTQFAVVRAIEIIGEAAFARDVFRNSMVGNSRTRDKLIHEYFDVNLSVVWRIVQADLPVLAEQLKVLLGDIGALPK